MFQVLEQASAVCLESGLHNQPVISEVLFVHVISSTSLHSLEKEVTSSLVKSVHTMSLIMSGEAITVEEFKTSSH